MKFVCKQCGVPCFVEFEDDCEFTPTNCPFDGESDAVWRKLEKKSMPNLTVEDSKPQLPDWLKLGAWAAVGKFVGKVDWISRDGSECRITCGESRFAKSAEVKPVTWRAWTFEEAPEAVKCAVSGILRIARLTLLANQGKPIHGYELPGVTCFASFEWMFHNATKLNSLPCGVPQVDGKDLEG